MTYWQGPFELRIDVDLRWVDVDLRWAHWSIGGIPPIDVAEADLDKLPDLIRTALAKWRAAQVTQEPDQS